MRVTACECDAAGWCPRHGCTKLPFHWQLCQRRPDFFALWEDGRGPSVESLLASDRTGCRHRSEQPITEVLCETCTEQVVSLPIFACQLYQRCAERDFGRTASEKYEAVSCVRCDAFEPNSEKGLPRTVPEA